MNKIFGAYLEDFKQIKLIIPANIVFEKLTLEMISNPLIVQTLDIDKKEYYNDECHLFLTLKDDVILHKDYQIKITLTNKQEAMIYPLFLGKVTRSNEFDQRFFYDGPLGFEYHKTYTIFRIWSPVCKEVNLIIKGVSYSLNYQTKGLWQIRLDEDLDTQPYYYMIRVNDHFEKTLDPYGISANANYDYNYVIDLNKTYQLNEYDKIVDKKDTVIYEINFRDLCKDDYLSPYLNAIKFLPYVKNLNITHLQLMPTFGFGGVNETIKDSQNIDFMYNWGYNPIAYFIPSGWYASNPDDPYNRINEYKNFINEAHKQGLKVVMDVVFNHVYQKETFCLGLLVPGYVYRTDQRGFLMNSSFCGNDLRTEAKMISKFIVDNLIYFQSQYKIDGFRFDLMGLIDNITLKNIEEELKKNNKNILLYGEGWYMNTTLPLNACGNLGSALTLPNYGFFNDGFRNKLRDSEFSFLKGTLLKSEIVKDILLNGTYHNTFSSVYQSINYVECHDNLTLYDKIKNIYPTYPHNNIQAICKLALGLVCLSKGITFIHAGQELMRSKQGIDNSYNKSDGINHFPYEKLNTNDDLSIYVKDLLTIKAFLPYTEVGNITFKNNHYQWRFYQNKYQIIIKNNFEEETLYFSPQTYLIFNNDQLIKQEIYHLIINTPGIWILEKK